MYLSLYRLLSRLAGPFVTLYLRRRKKRGKEDDKRFEERLGYPGFPRPQGPLIWIHAASIGESVSVLPLIRAINDKYLDVNILITTGTVTSSKLLESRLPSRVFHQYVPVDKISTVRRFLRHWRPSLALWVESELWPNLIIETHDLGCPMIQINARISQESCEKWLRYGSMANKLIECFSLTLAQSEKDKQRFERLGALHAKFVGNLKYDAPPLPADPKETGNLIGMVGDRPLWLAVSTHEGEEEMIAQAHQQLKTHHADLLTIIIPRHPERGETIAKLLRSKDLKTALRSNEETIERDTEMYVANTVGELGLFYRLSGIVFMGGSLVEHGGQNPVEPARLECALLSGPHTENFADIYQELISKDALLQVTGVESLTDRIDKLLTDPEHQEQLAERSLKIIQAKGGVLDAYMQELMPYLKTISHKIKNHEDA